MFRPSGIATTAYSVPRNTISLIGDSIIGQDTPVVISTDTKQNAAGAFMWANILLQQRFDVLGGTDGLRGYKGTSGNTSAQVLARIGTDVITYAPAYCLVEVGVNDVVTGVSSATTISNLSSILTALINARIKPIICTLPPSSSINTNAEAVVWLEVNRWIMDRNSVLNDVIVVDWSTPYLDVTAAFPNALAGYTQDGVHPNTKGAYHLGKAIYRACKDVVPKRQLFQAAFNSTETGAGVLITNPTMQGSGGTAGTGASGVIPASWTMTGVTGGAVVGSKVARTDGVAGEWAQMAFTGDATYVLSTDYSQMTQTAGTNLPAGLVVGDVVQCFSEVQINTGSTAFLGPHIFQRFVGATMQWSYGVNWESSAAYVVLGEDIGATESTIVIATPKVPIPASTSSLNLFLRMQPSAVSSAFTTRHGRTCAVKAVS